MGHKESFDPSSPLYGTMGGGTQSQIKSGKKYVKKKLGITEKNVQATKLTETKGGTSMFGTEASQATNEYLVSINEAKVGNYFRQEGGEFIRIGKEEGEKLYRTGDKSISRSYNLTSKGLKMKYGMTGGAMGSGDPTGVISSIPISAKMHEKQKVIQGIALGALSLPMPMGASQIMRVAAADAFKSKGKEGYEKYLSKFKTKQETVMGGKRSNLTSGKTFMTEEY